MEDQTAPLPLEIRMFGPFHVRLKGAPLPPLRTRKGQWLLALLVLKQGRPTDRAWLAGTLWPETTEEHAFTSLRKCLNDLRGAFGIQASRLHAPTPRTLALDLTDAFCDLTAFDAAIQCGERPALEEAVALYQGELLEECSEDWAILEREERRQTYLRALETLAAHAQERREPSVAIAHLQRCVALDPLRESAQRALMQAQADGGNLAAVTQTYREMRLYLRRELNTDPAPETTALYQQLRSEAQRRALNIGKRQQPGEKEETHPSSAPPEISDSIPRPVTDLIGREIEIEAMEAYLRRARLVTLMGTGGIGKTRLAIEIAQRQADAFVDGVHFVELAALSDSALLPQAVASVLGMREQSARPLMEALLQRLHDQELLLALDNCEHLVAECAQLAAALLHHCPRLRILATSRQALGVGGELVWRVRSLAVPDLEGLAEQKDFVSLVVEYDAVRLFVNRASLAYPGFRLSPSNARVVAQICQRLDGIPLAIELAAARIRVLTPEQIVARLDDRFHLLTGGSQDALPRQQTLRAALDWSYDLLHDGEKVLLRRLSVFVGGWTLEAAEQICSEEQGESRKEQDTGEARSSLSSPLSPYDILDLLTALVDRSLVTFEQTETGEGRYRLLETIRHYALERLSESGEQETMRARHFDYFLALAEKSDAKLHGPEQAQWLDLLEQEHGNLRAALQFSQEEAQRQDTEQDLLAVARQQRMAVALTPFWEQRCHWSEGRIHLERALAAASGAETEQRPHLLIAAGIMARRQGDYVRARTLHEESVRLCRVAGNQAGLARSLRNLGSVAREQGDLAAAREIYEESLSLARAMEDRPGIAADLCNLATVAEPEGDFVTANRLLHESLTVFREIGDKARIGVVLNNLGNAAYHQGELEVARKYYEENLTLRRELGNKKGIANTLTHLGNIARDQGEYEAARRLMEESLAIQREIGETQQIAYTLHNTGLTAFLQGDYATSRALHRESMMILERLQDRHALTDALEAFASLALAAGNRAKAIRLWAMGTALRETNRTPHPPNKQQEQDRRLEELKAALGADVYRREWEQGQVMTLEQAIEYALSSTETG